jgi:hypothetical protein
LDVRQQPHRRNRIGPQPHHGPRPRRVVTTRPCGHCHRYHQRDASDRINRGAKAITALIEPASGHQQPCRSPPHRPVLVSQNTFNGPNRREAADFDLGILICRVPVAR